SSSFYCPGALRHLHPFPTRRSSDLLVIGGIGATDGAVEEPWGASGRVRGRGHQRRRMPVNGYLDHVGELDAAAGQPSKVLQVVRSEEHTSELQSLRHLVCRLLLEKK